MGCEAGFAVDGVQGLRIAGDARHDDVGVGVELGDHETQQVGLDEGHIAGEDQHGGAASLAISAV